MFCRLQKQARRKQYCLLMEQKKGRRRTHGALQSHRQIMINFFTMWNTAAGKLMWTVVAFSLVEAASIQTMQSLMLHLLWISSIRIPGSTLGTATLMEPASSFLTTHVSKLYIQQILCCRSFWILSFKCFYLSIQEKLYFRVGVQCAPTQ